MTNAQLTALLLGLKTIEKEVIFAQVIMYMIFFLGCASLGVLIAL